MSEAKLPPAPAPFEATPALEEYMANHFKKVVLLIIAAVAVMLLFAFGQYKSHQKQLAAGEAFVGAKTVEDCDAVIQKFPGTEAAGNALLVKADLLWEQTKKDSSVAALKDFVAANPKHPLLAATLVNLASKLESSGQRDEAKALFERVVSEFSTTEVAPLAQLRIGDILWAQGKADEAKKVYESLPSKFPNDSSFTEQSEKRISWVNGNLPTKEVDGPPKPKQDKPAAPGAAGGPPQLKLNSGGSLTPTIMPQGATPEASPLKTPAMVAPSDVPAPTPGATPPAAPAPAATPTPAPAPAASAPPAAPAATPAPAAPAAPAPAPVAPAPVKPAP